MKKQNSVFLENRPHLIVAFVASIMLLVALAPLPYGYYQLLRLVICGIGIYMAIMSYYVFHFSDHWRQLGMVCLFIIIALLFNPLFPIHLTREVWGPIDLYCAMIFFITALILEKIPEDKKSKKEQEPINQEYNVTQDNKSEKDREQEWEEREKERTKRCRDVLLNESQNENKAVQSWPIPSGHDPNEGKCGWHFTKGYEEHIKKSVRRKIKNE